MSADHAFVAHSFKKDVCNVCFKARNEHTDVPEEPKRRSGRFASTPQPTTRVSKPPIQGPQFQEVHAVTPAAAEHDVESDAGTAAGEAVTDHSYVQHKFKPGVCKVCFRPREEHTNKGSDNGSETEKAPTAPAHGKIRRTGSGAVGGALRAQLEAQLKPVMRSHSMSGGFPVPKASSDDEQADKPKRLSAISSPCTDESTLVEPTEESAPKFVVPNVEVLGDHIETEGGVVGDAVADCKSETSKEVDEEESAPNPDAAPVTSGPRVFTDEEDLRASEDEASVDGNLSPAQRQAKEEKATETGGEGGEDDPPTGAGVEPAPASEHDPKPDLGPISRLVLPPKLIAPPKLGRPQGPKPAQTPTKPPPGRLQAPTALPPHTDNVALPSPAKTDAGAPIRVPPTAVPPPPPPTASSQPPPPTGPPPPATVAAAAAKAAAAAAVAKTISPLSKGRYVGSTDSNEDDDPPASRVDAQVSSHSTTDGGRGGPGAGSSHNVGNLRAKLASSIKFNAPPVFPPQQQRVATGDSGTEEDDWEVLGSEETEAAAVAADAEAEKKDQESISISNIVSRKTRHRRARSVSSTPPAPPPMPSASPFHANVAAELQNQLSSTAPAAGARPGSVALQKTSTFVGSVTTPGGSKTRLARPPPPPRLPKVDQSDEATPSPAPSLSPSRRGASTSLADFMTATPAAVLSGSGSASATPGDSDAGRSSEWGGGEAAEPETCTAAPPEEPESPTTRRSKHRVHVLHEIVDTEASYVQCLECVVKYFFRPLKISLTGNGECILSEAELRTVFSNIELVYNTHCQLLGELTDAVGTHSEPVQAQAMVGLIFVRIAPFFKMFKEYVANFQLATTTLQNLRRNNEAVRNFLDHAERVPDCKQMRLDFFLIMPVQRYPRYRLLLEDLLKHTADDHPDYNHIKAAVNAMQSVLSTLNECGQKAQSILRVVEIHSQLPPRTDKFNLVEPHRVIVREGVMLSHLQSPLTIFLFNDLLILAKAAHGLHKLVAQSRFRSFTIIGLRECDVHPEDGAAGAMMVVNQVIDQHTMTICKLIGSDTEQRDSWIKAIQAAKASWEQVIMERELEQEAASGNLVT